MHPSRLSPCGTILADTQLARQDLSQKLGVQGLLWSCAASLLAVVNWAIIALSWQSSRPYRPILFLQVTSSIINL